MNKLKFSQANTKLKKLYKVKEVASHLKGRKVYSLDTLSGHSCIGAKECKSAAVIKNGKRQIYDFPGLKFRCFSASQEVTYSGVYNLRSHNIDLIKSLSRSPKKLTDQIEKDLPKDCGVLRWHVAGDWMNFNQLKAALNVARNHKDIWFYHYTKSLPLLIKARDQGLIPDNWRWTASRGGKFDYLIDKENLREAVVVYSEQEAQDLGLEIDNDDSHCLLPGPSFGLLIHGVQRANSFAAKALQKIKVKK
jgi:hypothetical protein